MTASLRSSLCFQMFEWSPTIGLRAIFSTSKSQCLLGFVDDDTTWNWTTTDVAQKLLFISNTSNFLPPSHLLPLNNSLFFHIWHKGGYNCQSIDFAGHWSNKFSGFSFDCVGVLWIYSQQLKIFKVTFFFLRFNHLFQQMSGDKFEKHRITFVSLFYIILCQSFILHFFFVKRKTTWGQFHQSWAHSVKLKSAEVPQHNKSANFFSTDDLAVFFWFWDLRA